VYGKARRIITTRGTDPASRFGGKSEYDVADEVFMAIELQDGALQVQAGVARYQPEFDEVCLLPKRFDCSKIGG
jgi:predicted N-acetyltransferase YhbS